MGVTAPDGATTPGGTATPASTVSRAAMSPRQQAQQDAAALLAAFVPPPGATRLVRPPSGVEGKLNGPEFTSGDPDVVYSATLWQVPAMTPKQALAWEKAHLPAGFKLSGWSGEAVSLPKAPGGRPWPKDPYHYAAYWFAPPAGKAGSGQLNVGAVSTLQGQTYVRVDAEVAWQPLRPATEKVPAAAKVIVITAQPDMNTPHDIPAPVTVTDPAKVSRIVSLLDGLNIDPGGIRGCPAMAGRGIMLSFLATASGPVLATAHEDLPSCGYVDFTIGGRKQPTLSDFGPFAQKVLGIAGVQWRGWNLPK
jgi:hypothetical protein